MRKILNLIVVLAAFAMVVGTAARTTAQEPGTAPAAQAQAQDPMPIAGELLSVNPDAMTFVVKTADGSEARFRYTDKTRVTGAEKSVAGLATMKGAPVTVYFRMEGTANVATRIDVDKTYQQG